MTNPSSRCAPFHAVGDPAYHDNGRCIDAFIIDRGGKAIPGTGGKLRCGVCASYNEEEARDQRDRIQNVNCQNGPTGSPSSTDQVR